MKRLSAILYVLLFIGLGMVGQPQNASAQGKPWVTLFDGKNLDQWNGYGTANFQIADGSIVAVDKTDPKGNCVISCYERNLQGFRVARRVLGQ